MRNKGQKIEDAGFDEYSVWHAHHTEDKGSRYKDPVIYQNGSYLNNTENKYGDDIFCDYILDFAERNKSEQFFAYFPMALTHRPFEPTPDSPEWEEFESYTNSENSRKWRTFDTVEGWDDNPKFYKDMVEYHDKIIGRLIDGLEEMGLREDTLIIYVGDNGSPIEVCSIMHNHDEVCGGKGLTKDRGTHVPLICNQPGKIDKSVIYDLVDSTDFLPTILEAAGISAPKDYVMDGRSFYPQLLGENGTPRDWIFFHFDPLSPRSIISGSPAASKPLIRFVREKRWKLYDDGRLYDLKEDPDEDIPLLSSSDNDNSKNIRTKLEKVLETMQ